MKRRKLGILIISVVAITAFLLSYIISYASEGETIYVNLTKQNKDGVGYAIGIPTADAGNPPTNAYIWNLTTYDSENIANKSKTQRNLYCIKANYGDSWNSNNEKIVKFNLSYDLQKDRKKLLNIVDDKKTIDDVLEELLDATESGYYRELLWILDNSYIEGTATERKEFLSNIGIKYDSEAKKYFYEPDDTEKYDYSDYIMDLDPSFLVDGVSEEYLLTDADIKAVQRAAIWYYTNYLHDETKDEIFNNVLDDDNKPGDWLTITFNGTYYQQLADYDKATTGEGQKRFDQAQILYNYLIDAAANNAYKYTPENNYTVTNGAQVDTAGLETNGEKYILPITRDGVNYKVGPIVINGDASVTNDISIKVTNQNGTDITNPTFKDKDGNLLEIDDEKELIGIDGGFYIVVPRTNIEKVNVKIDITQETTNKTLWLNGTEDEETGEIITLKDEQPIVEVTRENETIPTEFESQPEEFDLALRKYIVEIDGTKLEDLGLSTRVPKISENTLKTETTATYNHRKDPVVVKKGNVVTYKLTIYNEGNHAGYASQIIDYLPDGLIIDTDSPSEIISKDGKGNDKNTYTWDWASPIETDKIVLTIKDTEENPAKSLEPYKNGTLEDESETIEIKCKVIKEADTENPKVLTNIAWISKAYDTDADKEILTKGQDIDSEPQTSPIVSQDKLPDYKGNKLNQDNLADSNYFFKGEQDDDDFEKLVIMPEVKKFDLALFKHIAAISKDQTIEPGEYITDTGNIDGTYLRAPVVKNIDKETGKITYQEDNKEPLVVEPGDYVLYTIRVYNEGEVNGYASKIKDALPEGLEFVVKNTEYNGIWNLDGIDEDGRQVVSTTWYAKGQGAELNAKEGDVNYKANLLMALDKEGEISTVEPANPDYLDAQVLCKVVEDKTSDRILVNYAQIADDSDEEGNPIKDIDSTPDEWIDTDDDQDIEKIKLQCFDLSLRKFITEVQEKEITSRVPQPKIEKRKITYEHDKNPLIVHVGDTIIYTIRVYNEGNIDGYAKEITDDIPEYLEYLPEEETNVKYMWIMYDKDGKETTKVEEAVKVKTTYLSKENGEDNLIPAFDGTTLSYKDVKIAFKVKDPGTNTVVITNHAQISDDSDKDGNDVEDIDSKPDEWNDGEDDQDVENVKVEYFDLSLLKFVTKVIVIEDGKETITETGYNGHEDPEPVVKVELHKKKLKNVIVKFGYGITITNEGDIPGYAKEITDYVPEGLRFEAADNPLWKDEGNNVISTRQLENKLLQPGESTTVEVILTWINDPNNLALKTNTAEISEDDNEYKVPDRDSTPDNKVDGEDDIDIAKVILAITTGAAKTYFTLTIGLLSVVLVGIILIKKFVI